LGADGSLRCPDRSLRSLLLRDCCCGSVGTTSGLTPGGWASAIERSPLDACRDAKLVLLGI
jgi:hypothetical protein